MRKVSVICTVLNEANTIVALLEALGKQTYQPQSVIIADGGSNDGTLQQIKQWQKKHRRFNLEIISSNGNRSVGRNAAIEEANTTYVAITDAGCVPHPDWLEQLIIAQLRSGAPVVAGYYQGVAKSPFEEAVIPYALVMPDRVDPTNFLPATRSMLIDKGVWRKLGGFDETLSDNEDYAFARAIQAAGIHITFTDQAVVDWQPRHSLSGFWTMIYRFARGDVQARLFRPKVLLIYLRYLLAGLMLGIVAYFTHNLNQVIALIMTMFVLYGLWAVHKNVRYTPCGWYWLPILQITSDLAVMLGTVVGTVRRIFK